MHKFLLAGVAALIALGTCRAMEPTSPDSNDEVISFFLQSLLGEFGKSTFTSREEEKTKVATLLPKLKDRDASIRSDAAQNLGRLGAPTEAVLAALIEALHDPESNVRGAACKAFGGLGPGAKSALPDLIKLVRKDPEGYVRRQAVDALVPVGKAESFLTSLPTILVNIVDLSVGDTSANQGNTYEMTVVHPGVIPVLIEALSDGEEQVRSGAIAALGHVGPQTNAIIPALLTGLKDPKSSVRAQVADVLGTMGPLARQAGPALQKLLTDSSPGVRAEAAVALWKIERRTTETVPVLVAALKEAIEDPLWTAFENQLEERRAEVVPDPNREFVGNLFQLAAHARREKVLETLRRIGPEAKVAVPQIRPYLQEKSPSLRMEAAKTLWKLERDPEPLFAVLTAALQDRDEFFGTCADALKILQEIGPEARHLVPALTKLIQDGHRGGFLEEIFAEIQKDTRLTVVVRNNQVVAAIKVLAAIGPDAKPAVPGLTGLARKHPEYQKEVAEALKKIDPKAAGEVQMR